jgi:hypothetical protein
MAGTPEEKKEKPANGTLCALTSSAYMGDHSLPLTMPYY